MAAESAFQETAFQKDSFQIEIGGGTVTIVYPKLILVDGKPALHLSGILYIEL
jgi:hypothetical protein